MEQEQIELETTALAVDQEVKEELKKEPKPKVSNRREKPPLTEATYSISDLASKFAKKNNLRTDLILVALREGGKTNYTVKEAESLILAIKKREVK
ncbi:MAG: hypothetical protein R3Y63_09005 [Eubacteriales bacterium]